MRVRAASLARGETVQQGPALRWTSALRTSVDLARRGPYEEAVVLVDRMVHAGLVDLRDVRAAAGALPHSRGSRLAREVAAAADGLAESPQETRLWLVLAASGLPMPMAQYEVRQGRDLVARADFAWPEHRLALEYDGLWHAEPGQFHRDRQRLNRLTAAGWRVVFATAADLHRPAVLVARLAAALG